MGQFVGADPEQLDALGAQMGSAADRLESIRQQIGFWLDSSPWHGSDADEFRSDWQHRLQHMLHTAATIALDGAAGVRRNAQQQREASDLGGGATGGAGGGIAWAGLFGGVLGAVGGGLATLLDVGGKIEFLSEVGRYQTLPAYLKALRAGGSEFAGLKQLFTTAKGGVVGAFGDYVQGLQETGRAAKNLDIAGLVPALGKKVLPVASLAFDTGTAAAAFMPGSNASTAAKVHAGGDVVFDALSIATTEAPPVSLAIDGAKLVFDLGMENPKLFMSAARTVASVAVDTAGIEIGATEAVGTAVSGGVQALRSLL